MCQTKYTSSSSSSSPSTSDSAMQSKQSQILLQLQSLERQRLRREIQQQSQSQQSVAAPPSASPSMHKKLINQLRPFRKVARSARINLNRYWGLLSQRYGSNSNQSANPSTSTDMASVYAAEMEQNRINEILEAQACAISQNSLNSQFEEQYSLRSRSSLASSVSGGSRCQYESCDCGGGLLMPSPVQVRPVAVTVGLHQRFASLASSSGVSSMTSPSSSPSSLPSFTSSTAELFTFNEVTEAERQLVTVEDVREEEDDFIDVDFDIESVSQYSLIL